MRPASFDPWRGGRSRCWPGCRTGPIHPIFLIVYAIQLYSINKITLENSGYWYNLRTNNSKMLRLCRDWVTCVFANKYSLLNCPARRRSRDQPKCKLKWTVRKLQVKTFQKNEDNCKECRPSELLDELRSQKMSLQNIPCCRKTGLRWTKDSFPKRPLSSLRPWGIRWSCAITNLIVNSIIDVTSSSFITYLKDVTIFSDHMMNFYWISSISNNFRLFTQISGWKLVDESSMM